MLDSPVGPNVTSFGGLAKLNINLNIGSYIPWMPFGHLSQKMEMLVTAALNTPSLRTIEIVFTISQSEGSYLSELGLERQFGEVNRLVHEGFARLSELSHVKTYVVVTARDFIQEEIGPICTFDIDGRVPADRLLEQRVDTKRLIVCLGFSHP